MAMKSKGWGAILSGLLNGGIEGYKTGRTLQDMAAERALKKKQFELQVEKDSQGQTAIGPDKTVYQTQGISPEAKARLLDAPVSPPTTLPGAINAGTGKISLQKPPTVPTKIINVPEAAYNENPSLYQEAPEGHKYNIVKSSKANVPPAIADAKDGLQQLRKIYLTNGSLSKDQAALARGYAKTIGSSVTTEEDTGLLSWVNRALGSPEYNLTPGENKANSSKTLTPDVAKQYLQKAGGDKNKARQLAVNDGYQL
jgi:hypothetical protein